MQMFTHAITRKPGPDFASGITTASFGLPDYQLLLRQHDTYVQTLKSLNLEVTILDPLMGFPDAYFVEDPAIIIPEIAIITRPGADARRGEIDFIEPVLSPLRKMRRIEFPGTLEGGDVLLVDRHFFIGVSERTNREGAEQLGGIVQEFGYTWSPILVERGLHLKSNISQVSERTLLVTQELAEMAEFKEYEKIVLDEDEILAANSLFINGTLVIPAGYAKTRRKLAALAYPIIELDMSEARKMDGGFSCMSLRF
jgi:dimethylargininase